MARRRSICKPWKEKLQSETKKRNCGEYRLERFFLLQPPQIKAVHRASLQSNIYIAIKESGCAHLDENCRCRGRSKWSVSHFFFPRLNGCRREIWRQANEKEQMWVLLICMWILKMFVLKKVTLKRINWRKSQLMIGKTLFSSRVCLKVAYVSKNCCIRSNSLTLWLFYTCSTLQYILVFLVICKLSHILSLDMSAQIIFDWFAQVSSVC